jgi:hypothetical protein
MKSKKELFLKSNSLILSIEKQIQNKETCAKWVQIFNIWLIDKLFLNKSCKNTRILEKKIQMSQ